MNRTERNRASSEFVVARVTCNVPLTQQVEMAVTEAQPVEADWETATWVGADDTVTVDGDYVREVHLEPFVPTGKDRWGIYVRIHDTPEVVVVRAGTLYLT